MGLDTYFRNVFLFIDRIKDAAVYREENKLRLRIPALLRELAQLWYTSGLNNLSKTGLRLFPELNLWAETLQRQFRRLLGESLSLLNQIRFLLQNAAN